MKTRAPALLSLLAFGVIPSLLAVDPPPGGGYPGNNTALGDDALLNLTTGTDNTALGFNALLSNTTAPNNTAVGSQALGSNTTGETNTAVGRQALLSNTTGYLNVAVGADALLNNITGTQNVAVGHLALYQNNASYNVAMGDYALFDNQTGMNNTAVGYNLMSNMKTGSNNCAFGREALGICESGSNNVAIGNSALTNAIGNDNIAIGYLAGSRLQNGDNNIAIGSIGSYVESNTIRIGTSQRKTVIAGIYGAATSSDALPVVCNRSGHLGTRTFSERFQTQIEPMNQASEAILSLHPVTFRYRHEIDESAVPQFGLVAEEVAKVDSNLVVRDEEGKPYSVRYDAVNAMLLNEFLKEHRKTEIQSAEIAGLKFAIAELRAAMQNQTAQIQKLSSESSVTKSRTE